MDNVKITFENDNTKNVIILTETDIIIDDKEASINDCIKWADIFLDLRKLCIIYAKEIVQNTIMKF